MGRGGGDGRWRWCIVDHDDLSQPASIVHLLYLAVADGVLLVGRPLALAGGQGRGGHDGGVGVGSAVERGVGVLGEQGRREMHGGLHCLRRC